MIEPALVGISIVNGRNYAGAVCKVRTFMDERRRKKKAGGACVVETTPGTMFAEDAGSLVAVYVSRTLYATRNALNFFKALSALHLNFIGPELYSILFNEYPIGDDKLGTSLVFWSRRTVAENEARSPNILPAAFWDRGWTFNRLADYKVGTMGNTVNITGPGGRVETPIVSLAFAPFYSAGRATYGLPHELMFPLFWFVGALMGKSSGEQLLSLSFFSRYLPTGSRESVLRWLRTLNYNLDASGKSPLLVAARKNYFADCLALWPYIETSLCGTVAYQDVLSLRLTDPNNAENGATIFSELKVDSQLDGDSDSHLYEFADGTLSPSTSSLRSSMSSHMEQMLGSAHTAPNFACSPCELERRRREKKRAVDQLTYNSLGRLVAQQLNAPLDPARPERLARLIAANVASLALDSTQCNLLIGAALSTSASEYLVPAVALATELQSPSVRGSEWHALLGAVFDDVDFSSQKTPVELYAFRKQLGTAEVATSTSIKQYVTAVCTPEDSWQRLWTEGKWALDEQTASVIREARDTGLSVASVEMLVKCAAGGML